MNICEVWQFIYVAIDQYFIGLIITFFLYISIASGKYWSIVVIFL